MIENQKQDFLFDIEDKIKYLWSGVVNNTYDTDWRVACMDTMITLIAIKAQILGLDNPLDKEGE